MLRPNGSVLSQLQRSSFFGLVGDIGGTKAEPGWFYGFRADVWQAYALAVYVADTSKP